MKKRFLWLLTAICLVYFLLLCKGSLTRYNYYDQEGDLAAYDNAIYHTSRGEWYQSTVSGSVTKFWAIVGSPHPPYPKVPDDFHLVGIHANWALALTNAPWTFLFPSPVTTLIVQTAYLALTGFLMGLLFLFWGTPPVAALCLVAGFFIHPATVGANLNAFHPIVMGSPFIPLFLIGLEKRKNWVMIVSSAILCLTQENAILTAMGLSLMPALRQKRYRFAAIHFAATTAAFLWMTKTVIPHYNEGHILPYGHLYGSPLGGNMEEIVKNGLKHPILLLQTVLTPEKLRWLFFQFLCFLPAFLAPELILIGLIGLAPNLLSNNPSMRSFWGQYNAMGFPFFVLAAGLGVTRMRRWKLPFAVLTVPTAALVFVLTIPENPWNAPSHWLFRDLNGCDQVERCRDFREVESRLRPETVVSSTDYLLTHISHRQRVYFFPVGMLDSQVSILEKYLPWWKKETEELFLKQMADEGYRMTFENSHFKVYEKKSP